MIALVILLLSGDALGQSCTSLSGAPFCGGARAHATVGNTVVFPQGPAARRVGNFIELIEDGKPRLAAGLPPAAGKGPPENARPSGHVIGLNAGRDFGAFVFPSGPAGRLSGRR